jgi:1-acyl-sn-glycerol-3-phosphate acyltransferase
MAIKAQVPLVPMALIGTWELLPIHSSQLHPVPVTLVVSEPIETKGMTMKQADALTAQLQERIEGLYYEHSWLKRPDRTPEGAAPQTASREPGSASTGRRDTMEVMAAGPQQRSAGISQEAGKP